MDKKLKAITDYYNNGQEEYEIMDMDIGDWSIVDVSHYEKNGDQTCDTIGFYEFLFNPKYKVFEVLFPEKEFAGETSTYKYMCVDLGTTEEIINYIYKEITPH